MAAVSGSVDMGQGTFTIDVDYEQLIAGLEKAKNAIKRELDDVANTQVNTFNKIGDKLQSMGTTLTNNITRPAISFIQSSVEEFNRFDKQMSDVQSILGITKDRMQELREEASRLSTEYGISATEIAKAEETIARAGYDEKETFAALETVVKTAISDNMSYDDSARILVDTLGAMGKTASEAAYYVEDGQKVYVEGQSMIEYYADILAQTSRRTNTNIFELGEGLKFAAPVAGAMGYELKDVAVAMGTMANAGIKGSMAGTAMRYAMSRLTGTNRTAAKQMEKLGLITTQYSDKIIQEEKDVKKIQKAQSGLADKQGNATKAQIKYDKAVEKYGEDSEQALKAEVDLEKANRQLIEAQTELNNMTNVGTREVIGISNAFYDADGNAKPFIETMEILRDKLGGLTDYEQQVAAKNLFGERAYSTWLTIINKTEDEWQQLKLNIDDASGALQEMTDIRLDNYDTQVGRLQESFNLLKRTIAEELVPVLYDLTEWLRGAITNFIEWWKGLDEGTRNMIKKLALLVIGLGPVLNLVRKLFDFLGLLKTLGVGTVIGKIAAVLKGMFETIYILGMYAMDGLMAAIDSFGAFLIANPIVLVIAAIVAAIIGIGIAIYKNWDKISSWYNESFLPWVEGLKTDWNALGDKIKEGWDTLIFGFLDGVYAMWQGLQDWWNGVKQYWGTAWNDFWVLLGQAWSDFWKGLQERWEELKTNLGETWDTLKNFLINNKIVKSASEFFNTAVDIGKNIVNGIIKGIKDLADGVGKAIKDAVDKANSETKNHLEIHSPSGVFKREIGNWIPLGIAAGVKEKMALAVKQMKESISSGMSNLISDIDTQLVPIMVDGAGYFDYNGQQFSKRQAFGSSQYQGEARQSQGDTFNFFSPEAIDEVQAARLLKQTKQDLAQGFI